MEPKELTNKEFIDKVFDYVQSPNEWKYKGDKPAIIDFYATWCGPCKATAPILKDIAEEFDGQIDVYKVDVDQEQELSSVFNIRSIPSILFIPLKGDPSINVGAMRYNDFKAAIQQMFSIGKEEQEDNQKPDE